MAPYPVHVTAVQAHPLIARLSDVLPGARVLTDPSETQDYRHDETAYLRAGEPLAVVFPRSASEVSSLVSLAAEHRVPLVPRGAGTGLSGGAVAVQGAITVVMTEMDRILEVDPDNLLVVTQPGVTNAAIGRAVAPHGLFYPPDPASYETCTLGGNLAEDAGGLCCVKYGVTGDYVLGLEVVLADGEIIRTGGRTVKDVMGYDLTHLFVGSEGTLGIITEATLRLRPVPATKATLLAFFPSTSHAGEAVSRITRAGLVPVTLELMDRYVIEAVEAALRLGLDTAAGAMLMIESDTGGQAAEAELDAAASACTAAGSTSHTSATEPAAADSLRQARREAHWSMVRRGVARMEDVGVPRDRITDLLDAIERRAQQHGVMVGVYGHAGDGNFHPTLVMDPDDADAEARVEAIRADLFADVLALDGTISGEHGVGLAKRGYLEAQRGRRAVAAMRAIKDGLDPLGILNRGKVFGDAPVDDESAFGQ